MLWTSDRHTIVNDAIKKCKLGEKRRGNKSGAWTQAQWSKANSCCWAAPLLTRTNQHEAHGFKGCAFRSFFYNKLWCSIMQRDKWILGSPQFFFRKNNSILSGTLILFYFAFIMWRRLHILSLSLTEQRTPRAVLHVSVPKMSLSATRQSRGRRCDCSNSSSSSSTGKEPPLPVRKK